MRDQEVTSGDALLYLHARYGMDAVSERDALDMTTIIENSTAGVDCQEAYEALAKQGWSMKRFGKAAINGRDYYEWLNEHTAKEILLADGSVQGMLPLWQETADSTEATELMTQTSPDERNYDDSPLQDPLDFSEQASRAEAYKTLLEGVLTKDSPELTRNERLHYEEEAENRLQSLTRTLELKTGREMEEFNREKIDELLGEFAAQDSEDRRKRLTPEYQMMRAAMLAKYLQGADGRAIQQAAMTVDAVYTAKVSSVRQAFVVFVEAKYRNEFGQPMRSPNLPRGRKSTGAEELQTRTANMNRNAEQAALVGYKQSKSPETHSNEVTRAFICTRLGTLLGGNMGAYRKVFNLMAEVIVTDTDLRDARRRLWGAVGHNLTMQGMPADDLRLTNEEVKWVAPLCGKKLVVDPNTKRLVAVDAKPETLADVKVLAHRLYTGNAYGKQPRRTAAEAEGMILSAAQKLLRTGAPE